MGRVRTDLGLSGFGVQLFDFRPGDGGPPTHDEASSGQEELYVVLGGGGRLEVDGELIELVPGALVSVAPGTTRTIAVGPDGLRYLCVGGVPGQAYEPPERWA